MAIATSGEPVPVPGGYLWTWGTGAGPPLIFCHGGPGLWDYTKPVADLISDQLWVVRFDQRGCGQSRCGPPFTLFQAVEDLDSVRRHFQIPAAVVGGPSWGPSLSLAYALRYPLRVRAVIYRSGVGSSPDWPTRFRQRRDAMVSMS